MNIYLHWKISVFSPVKHKPSFILVFKPVNWNKLEWKGGTDWVLKTRDSWATSLTWETVPINKDICSKLWLSHFVDYERKKTLTPFENWIILIRLKLNLIQTTMPFVKFGWNWPSGSGEDDFKIPLIPRMLCAKFGWK